MALDNGISERTISITGPNGDKFGACLAASQSASLTISNDIIMVAGEVDCTQHQWIRFRIEDTHTPTILFLILPQSQTQASTLHSKLFPILLFNFELRVSA